MWDNRIFNVNGDGLEMLTSALELAFKQETCSKNPAIAYRIDPKYGMIILWSETNRGILFPSPLDAKSVASLVMKWLQSEPKIECMDWDADEDHDGSNSLGWRVYCEDWGYIGDEHYAICAIKPAYLWHGK